MIDFITRLVLLTPPILLALTVHEYAHGYVAWRLGDPTAKMAGRLTLNPLRHLDPIGTVAFFIIQFGWARPVPVNGAYFKNPQKDMLWVAMAGPMTNLGLAIISAIAAHIVFFIYHLLAPSILIEAVLVPFYTMLGASVWINLVLCIFNFLPIPPLDGSRILMGLLPENLARTYASYEKFGFLIILVLIFTNVLQSLIGPVVRFANTLLLP